MNPTEKLQLQHDQRLDQDWAKLVNASMDKSLDFTMDAISAIAENRELAWFTSLTTQQQRLILRQAYVAWCEVTARGLRQSQERLKDLKDGGE